jgi:hypothetical protein
MWLTGAGVACVLLLLLLNTIPMILSPKVEKYLKYNFVRGMAVEHKNKLYTLGFNQQNEMIGFFNRSVPVDAAGEDQKQKLDISKIVVYRFNAPDLIIIPIAYEDDNLIFSSPEWNSKGVMKDVSQGALKNLLLQTYDP